MALIARLNYCELCGTLCLNLALQCFVWAWSANGLSSITLNLKQLSQRWQKHLHVAWTSFQRVTLAQTGLPGMALAQRTTVTSCRSPSSLRLVSKDTGLSGWAGSCPALTTAGSMVCRTLSREREERRVGGMTRARAWEAAEGIQTERGMDQIRKQYHIFNGMFGIHLAWYLALMWHLYSLWALASALPGSKKTSLLPVFSPCSAGPQGARGFSSSPFLVCPAPFSLRPRIHHRQYRWVEDKREIRSFHFRLFCLILIIIIKRALDKSRKETWDRILEMRLCFNKCLCGKVLDHWPLGMKETCSVGLCNTAFKLEHLISKFRSNAHSVSDQSNPIF